MYDPGRTSIDRAGQTGNLGQAGLPDWLVNAYVTVTRGRGSFTLQTRFISAGTYNAQFVGPQQDGYATTNPLSISSNRVGHAVYVNAFGYFNIMDTGSRRVQVFGSVMNVLDEKPPFAAELQYPTNPVYFDQIGRQCRIGVRFTY